MNAYLAEQTRLQAEQQEQQQEYAYRQSLAQQLQSQVHAGLKDEQTAELEFQNAVVQRDLLSLQRKMQAEQQASVSKITAFETDQKWAEASKLFEDADKTETMAYHKSGVAPTIAECAKISHERANRLRDQGRTLAAAKLADNATTPPTLQGSASPQAPNPSAKPGQGFSRFFTGHKPFG